MLKKTERHKLALEAMRRATSIRSRELHKDMVTPICIYDAAETLGVTVKIMDYDTVEGAYFKGEPANIIVTSRRPAGRRSFTCAHELGHHVFGHGDILGEILNEESGDPDEFLVDSFAGYLLMPPTAVKNAFTTRGWSTNTPSPHQVFVIAGVLGVGYTTLINHMHLALNILPEARARALSRIEPKDIRTSILGRSVSEDVLVVDQNWPINHRTIDAQVGDYLILPPGTVFEGDLVTNVGETPDGEIFRSLRPGIGRYINYRAGWAAFTRISRRNYTGLARYRHLADEEYADGE